MKKEGNQYSELMSDKQSGSVPEARNRTYYPHMIGGGPISNFAYQTKDLRGMSIIRNAQPDKECDDIGLPGQGEAMKKETSLDEDKEYIITDNGPIEIKDDYLDEESEKKEPEKE